ncbi:uncharacterized protein LOC143072193 isoform X3 [Mytilus galloprovincialis]|uniref:uncharacterized protein LOC143072193 isoform X3 n=1 Tax=Mytilus galloprovincialis TaxID=29158 RepID=UPI003F7C4661
MEGEDILSVQEIKRRSKTLSSDYMHIKTVKEGSIIICLDVESSAFTSLGFFLELIETLLSTVLQRNHDSNNDSTSCVIISLDFMDTNNESLVFRKPLSDRKELMGSFPQIKEERELLHEENMRRIFMYDRQEFDLCLHDIARYLNVGNSLCTLQTEHAYVSSNKRRERRNEYERPNKMAKLLIEDEGNLMAKMSNVDDMVLQTTVDNCTSPAARITPIYSDKSVPERVQIKQEPKNDSEDSEDVCDCGIFHKTFDSLQIFEQHKRKCRAERQKDYGKPNKNAKLFIEDEVSLMAKMSNVNDMVLQTPVKNFTSTAARITIYSDKSVPERVQIKQEPKSELLVLTCRNL